MYDDAPTESESARATTPGDQAIQHAEQATTHLSETISHLVDRLAPVLRPDGRAMAADGPSDPSPPSTLSDVAWVFRAVADRSAADRARLADVLDRLDF